MEDQQLTIPIQQLKNRHYDFEYTFGLPLFKAFGSELVDAAKLKATVSLDKSETMIRVNFQIAGTVVLECDRTLRKFEHPLATSKQLLFKYGEHWDDFDDEIIIIPYGHSDLDISQYLYDFTVLALPSKKVHPDLPDEEEGLFFSTEPEEGSGHGDPRWEALKKLKFKKD